MALRFGLVPNHFTDDPDDCMGVVTDNETVTMEQIIEKMIGKGSTVTKAEALAVIEEFNYAVVDAVANGNSVNTELFKITPSISGVFVNEDDSFDKERHSVRMNLNPGSRLNQVLENIELKKVKITSPQPILQKFTDLKTNTVNESFTPGQIASLKGSLLKVDASDDVQGIYFIASDGTETKVSQIVKNKPSELLFFAPEGLTGVFSIEVRIKPYKGKTLRAGRLVVDLNATV